MDNYFFTKVVKDATHIARSGSFKIIAVSLLSYLTMFLISAKRTENPSLNSLKVCLRKSYELDQNTIEVIIKRLSFFFEIQESENAIKDFIENSKELLAIHVPNRISSLSDQDALIAAPETHEVLYEDTEIRILFVNVKPNETVPPHMHQLNAVMLTLQATTFLATDENGNSFEEYVKISSEILPGSTDLFSYKNIGTNSFHALLFELK